MNFDRLTLSPLLKQAAEACGYSSLTQVQAEVIPVALTGADLMACAETGTGKTAAFSFSLLQGLLSQQRNQGELNVLVLTPTRELAIQVSESIARYGQFTGLTCVAAYGGANINPQRKALAKGADILVATPGRLFDLIGQHDLDLAKVNCLVIDEADRMLDLGFVKDIERAKRLLAPAHATMMFSATFSPEVKALANAMLAQPKWINVAKAKAATSIEQLVYLVDKRRKAELLAELIGRNNWQQVLVFVNTKESAELLHKELRLDGINNAVFHGDKTQGARNRALEQFKSGALRVLVATDVAARGLDISALPLVVNVELPTDEQDYVHRIGRTGRAGLSGRSISLVAQSDEAMLQEIETLIGSRLPRHVEPGYELGAPLPARYRELQVSGSNPSADKRRAKTHAKSNAGGRKKSLAGRNKRTAEAKRSYASRRKAR